MTSNFVPKHPEVQVITLDRHAILAEPVPQTGITSAPRRDRLTPFLCGAWCAFMLAALAALGGFLFLAYERQAVLRDQLAAAEAQRAAEVLDARQSVSFLEQRLAAQSNELAGLEASRRAAEEALAAQTQALAAAALRGRSVRAAASLSTSAAPPEAPAASASGANATPAAEPVPEPVPAEPSSPLRKALMATDALTATTTSEPPTLDAIEAHIDAGDPLVVNNLAEAAKYEEKGMLTRIFTHSIFIDSAVLGASLLVPPSLPLTLAQSRLGRSLTSRVLKQTDTDKSLAGKVAKDVGNMPITRKKSKK